MHTFIAALFIKLFRILNLCLCRKTWTWWRVFLFMVLRMFHFFQAIFATNFNVIFKDYHFCSLSHIQRNLHLKLTIYFKHKVTFLWAISQKSKETLKIFVPHPSLGHFSKGLRDIEDVCPSSQCGPSVGHWERKLFAPKNLWNWQCYIHMKYGDINF